MDISKLLKTVNNVDDYISVTETILSNHSNSRIQFNMSTVLALKKIRSIEIEYFTKCNENGAALKIFELMLQTPPSKTWSLLGKELILLIQYWLDAIRKHLILHTIHWWSFLSALLKFIQEIHIKSLDLNTVLIQETTEGLLDLATQNLPDVKQRYQIVQCVNSFCAESNREIRLALRAKFEDYFIKLSSQIAVCGDIRTQYSIMETLLRWLLPRQNLTVRREASAKWFPPPLYSRASVDVFMKRHWQNFFKDARDFLNAHNEASDLVTSFICRRFSIGNLILISKTDKKDYYVDLNSGSKCISLMLEPKMLETLGSPLSICDALIIEEDNTDSVQLYRNLSDTIISVTILDPLKMYSSSVIRDCDVTIVISSSANLKKIDKVLRNIFDTKYQLLIDIDDLVEVSPRNPETRRFDNTSEDDTRFSHPLEIQRRKHSGYIARNKHPVSWQSPSTASTSSLAMLKDKLSALPGYRFNKEPVSVCAEPELSCVTEVTETEENITASQSTLKLKSFGVCHKKIKKNKLKCQSDNDSSKAGDKCTTPVVNDNDNSVSCLLVATIGSADDSVINDTLERLPKNKEINTDNIVDLLTREALQCRGDGRNSKNIGIVNHNETVNIHLDKKKIVQKKQTIVSNTTTDDSNTEMYEDTPNVLNVEKERVSKRAYEKVEEATDKQTYDIQEVEDFFSQHFAENKNGDIVISPTLARKLNETSSESSESFDFPIMNIDTEFDFNEVEIVECLNDIVDKVCKDFDKCTELFNEDLNSLEDDVIEVESQMPLNEITNNNVVNERNQSKKKSRKSVKGVKLTYKKTKLRGRNNNKLNIETVSRMSPIKERDSAIENLSIKEKSPEKSENKSDYETPLIRRKRKLYSPKDDHKVNDEVGIQVSETEEDTMPSAFKIYDNTPKSFATSYKEIDLIRKESIRKLRNKKILRDPPVSPRTKKMNDMFDNLKRIEDNQEKIQLANKNTRNKKLVVYNFNSDSEEEDFKMGKTVKKSSSTTLGSEKSAKKRTIRRSKRINKLNNSEAKIEANAKPKTVRTRASTKKQTLKSKQNLEDERMRETVVELLNTSLIIQEPQDNNKTEGNPIIKEPEMETMVEEPEKDKKKIKKDLSLKKKGDNKKINYQHSDKDSESPLPCLIVETAQIHKDADDSVKSVMLDNLKDISEFNTTPNLLNDLENNKSPYKLNITDEFNKINIKNDSLEKSKIIEIKSNNKKCEVRKLSSDSNASDDDDVEVIRDNRDISIATEGRSPITARGDLDGSPPNTEQLTQPVAPRELEIEDLNQSMQDYFKKLTNQLNDTSPGSRRESNIENTKNNNKSPEKVKKLILDKSPSVSIARLSPQEIRKWLPTRLNSVFDSNQSSDEVSVRKTRSQSKCSRRNDISSNATKSVNLHRSLISPIKMFGEKDKAKSASSQGDDYVNRIKGMMSRKTLKPQSPKSQENITKSDDSSTISKKSSKSGAKRKASPILSTSKVKKVYSISSVVNTVETGSSASIQEWFKRNDRDNPMDSLDQSLKDHLEQIMEKLDTTLVEIHHMTSKKFINMFVDAQKHLNELKADRRGLYRETATHMMSEIVKIMDNKFADLDKRSQEVDEQFIENIKSKAKELIREDCKQKRTMVTLLREDIQAVLNNAGNDD